MFEMSQYLRHLLQAEGENVFAVPYILDQAVVLFSNGDRATLPAMELEWFVVTASDRAADHFRRREWSSCRRLAIIATQLAGYLGDVEVLQGDLARLLEALP